MSQIRFQIGITLDDDAIAALSDIVRQALGDRPVPSSPKAQATSPPMTPIERSQHAMFGGKKPPENLGLLLTYKEAGKLLKVSDRTVWTMSHEGKMPKPIRIGQSVRFCYEELRAWANAGCPPQSEWKYEPESKK